MAGVLQDLRYGWRGLVAAPGFALAAILSLAIGIGANTAMFSVVHALLVRPLPYANADRLVILWNRSPGLNITEDWFSTAQYFDIKAGHTGFDDLAIALGANYSLTGRGGDPERVGVMRVSANLLRMLGARPERGRLFAADEDGPGRALVAVLGHGLWMRRYGGDPAIVGASITLNGLNMEVVGILPRSFALPREVLPTLGVAEDGEIFLPLRLPPNAAEVRTHEDYNILGTLKPGVTVARAQAEMDGITARLRRDHPDAYPPNGGLTFSVVPLLEQVVGNVRRTVVILAGSVAFVLLIACANVANLLLARALARQKEIAVRAALGAGRARLLRQLLTESVMLACAGGAVGVLCAVLGVAWIHALHPANLPRLRDISVNGSVLLVTVVISVFAGVLFGLAPALGLRRINLYGTLKDAGRGSAGAGAVWGRGHSARRLLVVAELALSVVLLVGAGLLVRSFASLQRVQPGFDPANVLTLEVTMMGPKYGNSTMVGNTYRDLWQRLDHVPGVTAAGGVTSLPLSGFFAWGPITVEGRTPPVGENFLNADQRVVAGRYFEAMRIPLLRGRVFTEQDIPGQPRVVIVDDFMANELWPGQDPIGKRVRFGGLDATPDWLTVVGVVGRVKEYSLDAGGRIALYFPHTQAPARALYVVVRGEGGPAALIPAVTRELRAIDPDLPLYHVRSMTDWVDLSLARQRFSMLLLTIFAGLAVALAAIGIYGVMAYLVSQGTREIGIRIALGASERRILGLVLRQGMTLGLAGVALGLGGALLLAGVMQNLLFGVPGRDAMTFVAVAILLGLVALVATWVPARRAARTDPLVSLRAE
jgi:predicted permease